MVSPLYLQISFYKNKTILNSTIPGSKEFSKSMHSNAYGNSLRWVLVEAYSDREFELGGEPGSTWKG